MYIALDGCNFKDEELTLDLVFLQLRAPGSPVIIVGTHLDTLSDPNRHTELEKLAFAKYSGSHYPKVLFYI